MVSHVKPLLQCARDDVDIEFVTLVTLLEIPVSGCTCFKTLLLLLRFFLSSTGVLVTDFFAPLVAVITMCYCYYVVASVVSHYSDEWVSKAVLLQLAHFNFACSISLFFHKNFYAIYIRHKIIKV